MGEPKPDFNINNENIDKIGVEIFGKQKKKEQTEIIFSLEEAAKVLGVSVSSLQEEAEKAMESKEKTKNFLFDLFFYKLPKRYSRGGFREFSLKKMPNGTIMLGSRFTKDKTNKVDQEYNNEVGLELFGEPKNVNQTEVIFSLSEVAYVIDIPLASLQHRAEQVMQNRERRQDFLNDFIFELPEKYHNGRLLEFEMKKINGIIMLGSRFVESELDPSSPDAKILKILKGHPELFSLSPKTGNYDKQSITHQDKINMAEVLKEAKSIISNSGENKQ